MTRRGSAADPLAELLAAIPRLGGRPATVQDRQRFTRYLDLLLEWNRVHDLTGHKQPRDIVRGLFLDSLLFLPQLPPRPIRLVDIGSGAGIPGLPLRILDPGIDLTVVESRRKRVSFLSTVRRELGLELTVVEGRAEEMLRQQPEIHGKFEGRFDAVTARGVAPSRSFLATCLQYARVGGRVIISAPPAPKRPPLPYPHARWVKAHPSIHGLDRSFLVIDREA